MAYRTVGSLGQRVSEKENKENIQDNLHVTRLQ